VSFTSVGVLAVLGALVVGVGVAFEGMADEGLAEGLLVGSLVGSLGV